MTSELVNVQWPQRHTPVLHRNQDSTRGLGGIILKNRLFQRKRFIPFNNSASAQVQQTEIAETLAPLPAAEELKQDIIPTPRQEVQKKQLEELDESEQSTDVRIKREKRLKTIFDAK